MLVRGKSFSKAFPSFPPLRAKGLRGQAGVKWRCAIKAEPAKNIDEYIAGFPREVQARLRKIRAIIRKAAPEAAEAIKYQIPTFVLNGNLVHFAAFPKHIGFYPTPSAIKAFSAELADYESAKGSVQFPLDKPVPFELIERMVAFRVKEAREKSTGRKRK